MQTEFTFALSARVDMVKLRHSAKFRVDHNVTDISRFLGFQGGGRPPPRILKEW